MRIKSPRMKPIPKMKPRGRKKKDERSDPDRREGDSEEEPRVIDKREEKPTEEIVSVPVATEEKEETKSEDREPENDRETDRESKGNSDKEPTKEPQKDNKQDPEKPKRIDPVNIEQILLSKGYLPKEKILIRSSQSSRDNSRSQGDLQAKYIKTYNRYREKVYVELDLPGSVSVHPDDITLVEVKTAPNSIAYTTKTASFECCRMDVSGVIFVFEDGICTLTKEEGSTTPKERNYILKEGQDSTKSHGQGHYVCHPLVRFSEIVSKPDLILLNTNNTNKRLRKMTYKLFVDQTKKIPATLPKIDHSLNEYLRLFDTTMNRIDNSLKILEGYNRMYKEIPTSSNPQMLKNYEKLQYNMRKRYEMIDDLLGYSLQDVGDRLCKIVEDIDSMISTIRNEFENVDQVFE